jgi:uncharacterized protein YjiS (DUF1127 family)
MTNVGRHQLGECTRYLLQDVPSAHFVPPGFIGDQFRRNKVLRWFQDEWLRYAMIRSLHRLNDDCLDDIGIKRKDIRPIVNAIMRRIRKGRRDRQHYPILTLTRMPAGS